MRRPEVVAFIFALYVMFAESSETLLNLAAGRPTYQSSDYLGGENGRVSSRYAVDGFGSDDDICANTEKEAGAWWVVDIGGPHRVEKVFIINRKLHVNRLTDFYIRVGNSFNETAFNSTTYNQCWYQTSAFGEGERKEFTCNEVIVGRYVAIHFPESKTEYLTLCEVEVYSDIVLLSPNVARNGTATQVSNYHQAHDPNGLKYSIDGRFDTDMINVGRCFVTASQTGAWWQVELAEIYKILKVAITTRYAFAGRLSDFYIDVSKSSDGSSAQQCAYDAVPFVASETRVYTCPSWIYGRYVRIHYAPTKTELLQLCEVQVQGVSPRDRTDEAFFYQNNVVGVAARGTHFLLCLSKCLLDETCTAVNLDETSCRLLSPDQYSSNAEVDYYVL